MTKRQKKRAEIRRLKEKEKGLESALAHAVGKRDELDRTSAKSSAVVSKQKSLKEKGFDYDPQKLEKAESDLYQVTADLKQVRQRIRERKGWLKRTRQRLGKARRQMRNLWRPRIIDLNLQFVSAQCSIQGTVDKVVGHYTAGPQDEDTADAIRLCRIYHDAHRSYGWAGIGYLLNVTVDGDILLLRPARFVGAHTLGHNSGSLGPMVHGTLGDKPTKAQRRALRWWAKHGHKKRMRAGRAPRRPDDLVWYGHNDLNSTSCPGPFKPLFTSKGKKV